MRVAALAVLFLFGALRADDSADAQKAAESWLALVDSGKYGESWEQASAYFKNAMPKAKWEQALNAVRKPLGAMESRKLTGATPTKQLPGAPDGEYVVIQYNTSFANKKSATETITPSREKDDAWRVSGYFIK